MLPWRQVEGCIDAQHIAHHVVETLAVQDEGQFVDVAGVGRIHHRLLVHVAQSRDLALQAVGQRLFATAHDDIGLDATAAQLGDRVLSGLGLLLAARPDERNQRDVDVAHVVASRFLAELADRLEEREDLDVTHRAAHLGDDHVDIVGGQSVDTTLDLVGDVRDDLHRLTEVIAATFGSEHRLVDGAGCGVRVAAEVLVDEPLVVAEVEVGLAAIVGDEYLAVLEGVHRAGVDVDVWVELLHRHPQATHLQQAAERGPGETLAQRGGDAPGHEHVLGHLRFLRLSRPDNGMSG